MSTAPILIVDDDDVLSRVLRRVLTRDGHEVVEAGSVAQALDAVRDHTPRLALLDLCLPDGDGMELARKLRTQGSDFPLILMTAYPLRLRDHPELGEAFACVLTKPLDVEDLRRAIEAALAGRTVVWGEGPVPGSEQTPRDASPPADPSALPPRPAPLPSPAAPLPSRRPLLIGAAVVAVVVLALALAVALPALGVPGIPNPFKAASPPPAAPGPSALGARRVAGDPNALLVAAETIELLHLTTAAAEKATQARPLELSGVLNLDPNYLGHVHALFPGEVVELATVEEPGVSGTVKRPLGFGDPVKENQVLAVLWSRELGEKKNDLIEGFAKLWTDQDSLVKLQDLYKDLATSETNVRLQRSVVANDLSALDRARNALRIWGLKDKDVAEVEAEARTIYDQRIQALKTGEMTPPGGDWTRWARVEVRARFDGQVVEKNVRPGDVVDATTDLYKIADLRHMAAWVHVYEEYLPELEALPRPIPWRLEAAGSPLDSAGAEEIGPIIDPNQHTALLIGRVDNSDGKLRVGQFVTATIHLRPPEGLTVVPAAAVVEDGVDSVVFVKAERQPDAKAVAFSRRRVVVVERLPDVLLVRAEGLTPEEKNKGLQALHPGEVVATSCVVELKAELETQQEPEKAE